MAEAPNLDIIIHVEPDSITPDIPLNFAIDVLAEAQTGLLTKTITGSDVTLTNAEAQTCHRIKGIGLLTGNHNIIVPAKKKPFTVEHACTGGFTLTIKTPSGTGVTLNPNTVQPVFCDGVNVGPDGAVTGAGGTSFVIGGTVRGLPGDGALTIIFPVPFAMQIPAGMVGSYVTSEVAADAAADFDVRKNGVSVGTIHFAAAATTATFVMASATTFAAGDKFTVIGPSPQDADLANLGFAIVAIKL